MVGVTNKPKLLSASCRLKRAVILIESLKSLAAGSWSQPYRVLKHLCNKQRFVLTKLCPTLVEWATSEDAKHWYWQRGSSKISNLLMLLSKGVYKCWWTLSIIAAQVPREYIEGANTNVASHLLLLQARASAAEGFDSSHNTYLSNLSLSVPSQQIRLITVRSLRRSVRSISIKTSLDSHNPPSILPLTTYGVQDYDSTSHMRFTQVELFNRP